jgi:CBS domain-containing protein
MSIELEKVGLNRFQKISTIAQSNPSFCKESDSIKHVMEIISKTGHRRIPIVSRRKKFIGLITVMDVLDAFLRRHNFNEKISSIMPRDVTFCEADDAIGYVLQKFKISRKGSLPVLHKSKLVGFITERELINQFSKINFDTKVEELMTRKPLIIKPNTTILETIKAFVNTNYRRLPVVDNKKLAGFITAIDIVNFMNNNSNFSSKVLDPIESIMTKDVHTIKKTDDISEAIKLLAKNEIGGLPVVDENNLLEGLITERDILEEIV